MDDDGTTGSDRAEATDVPVRPAATVVLVRDTVRGLEVFLLHRVAGMVFAGGAAVFPGGAVDPGDHEPAVGWIGPDPELFARAFGLVDALPVLNAAMRELFEESGVALAATPSGATINLLGGALRTDLAAHRISWAGALAAAGAVPRADLLRPWARRTTPPGRPRRYDTCFFLARLPVGQIADAATTEAESGGWTRPAAALQAWRDGTLQLLPPTRRVLGTLAEVRDTAQLFEMPLPLLPDATPFVLTAPIGGPALIRHTTLVSSRLAPNPGPMTLDGTNSYVLAGPGSTTRVVVDPGPLDAAHLAALAGGDGARVELILITHRHHDHTEAAAALHAQTGAPVRATDPVHCFEGPPLRDGELITAAGVRIMVVMTPGHTADSTSFLLRDDEPLEGSGSGAGSVLTGDTILGRGTTVLAPPDGSLPDFLTSLETLIALGPATVLPGHGPALPNLVDVASYYRAHRHERLDQVRAALAQLGTAAAAADVAAVTALVYADVEPSVLAAAEMSVRVQLDHLRETSGG